jgi:heme/copper-type cytochrome/quinol oxidase subunit 2
MKKFPLENRAVALPLAGAVITWWAFMVAQLIDIFTPQQQYDTNGMPIGDAVLHPSIYVFFAGILAVALCSLVGQSWAIKARAASDANSALARSAHRFANLMVILSLAAGVIFVFGTFMGAFNSYSGRSENLMERLLDVYLPILLGTAMVVWVLLRAFVLREHGRNDDGTKARMSERQKALTLGYVVPILATAFAIIFGLIVYDITRTTLQVWVWVIIVLIVAFGVVAGTRFAAKAKSAKAEAPKPRTALAEGAAVLNFVLSIVYGGVVGIMAFTYGSSAVQKLQQWSNPPIDCKNQECQSVMTLKPVTWQWLIEDAAPAKVLILLAVVGVYFTITERNRQAK